MAEIASITTDSSIRGAITYPCLPFLISFFKFSYTISLDGFESEKLRHTLVIIFFLPFGIVFIIEISRSPNTTTAIVLGIGVAVITIIFGFTDFSDNIRL